MSQPPSFPNRRRFVSGAAVAAGLCGFNLLTPLARAAGTTTAADLLVIQPQTPAIHPRSEPSSPC